MSSTLYDVCELWNRSQIVRVMGSSPIKQILFFPSKKADVDTGSFYTLETAVKCGLLEKEQGSLISFTGSCLRIWTLG